MSRFFSLLCFFLIVGCALEQTVVSDAKEVSVKIEDFAFNPATLYIKQGAVVTWTNQDALPHTVTGDGFDSGRLVKGAAWSHSFMEKGTYKYSCSYHPSMQGMIVVE